MKKKKILFVDARWVNQPGQGVSTYFHEVYSRIHSRHGGEIEIIYGVVPGALPSFLDEHAQIYTYKSDSFFWRLFFLGFEINKLQPNFVHFQYTFPLWLNHKIVKILALHDLIFLKYPEFFLIKYRYSRKFLFRRSAKQANYLLTISESSKLDISKIFKIPLDQILLIPLGTGSRLKSLVPVRNKFLFNKKFILTVGRHEPRKNYTRLIEAFISTGLFNSHDLYLVIAGWVPSGFGVSLGSLEDNGIIFLTECADSELSWLYINARGFIFPSIAEGYGLPLVEALEFGLPAAVSSTYPIDSVKKICCCVFNPFSIAEIKNSIDKLFFENSNLNTQTNNLETWDHYVQVFIKIIKDSYK